MSTPQAGIMVPVPAHSRYLEFSLIPDGDPKDVLATLSRLPLADDIVIGVGPGLVAALGKSVEGLKAFPVLTGPGVSIPSTQSDLMVWVRGDDRGHILHTARTVENFLDDAFDLDLLIDGFKYDRGLDLTGYEDGTENPEGDDAIAAAFVADGDLAGSSFVALQLWQHDLDYFNTLAQEDQDDIIGRRLSDNVEFEGSPSSAHTKRTAQESFDPEAFMLRRSMPWSGADGDGLMFVAFAKSFYSFEAQLGRMTGQEDGVTDGLFRFSRPLTGSYYWCPPVEGETLNLKAIGL